MNVTRFATRWNADLIEQQYQNWLNAPEELDADWRHFFEGFTLGLNGDGNTFGGKAMSHDEAILQARVTGAIYAYRSIGHTQAAINPLQPPVENPRLTLERLGFSPEDMGRSFHTGNYLGGTTMPVGELLDNLKQTYCGTIGCEYLHIQDTARRRWLQARMEPSRNQADLSREKQIRALRKICEAEIFESFLHTRYVGQKRFSLEGAETLIAALDAVLEHSPTLGIEEIVMGMAHRGRLNVLANILNKSYEYIFKEFSENYQPNTIHGDGDVKYHLGYATTVRTSSGQDVEIRLAANPSHLEAVNPVVQGNARARQRIRGDVERKRVLPLLIHGDAAMVGQGVVAEVFNLSQLKGYRTGGTLHIVVNNQIGFTTDPSDSRSSRYCTDVAKMIEVPIFHVNSDDPLAMVHLIELVMDYRQEFGDDVVIDLCCYRKHGHNEADEPLFTQPVLYRAIAEHPPTSEVLGKTLLKEGILDKVQFQRIREDFQEKLDEIFIRVKKEEESQKNGLSALRGSNAIFQPPYSFQPVNTGASRDDLAKVVKALTTLPDGFQINSKIKRQLEARRKTFDEDGEVDWAFAEALAFGTLLIDGTHVRLSGQDCERGTFSQRHAVIYSSDLRERYVPLLNVDKDQAMYCVHNSSLSEAAILGFDYGYSVDFPEMLCIWEAQFGDFVNGAQVIIDQFITSSESKWQRISGLVMLLPHGYEGQGPEHSSARLERFLQACAENNIQVCNASTPAQYFHLLRRQMKRPFRKPLVIMSPKSLLRSKACVSPVKDFTEGKYQEMLDDPTPAKSTDRLILCSGKVYYDLVQCREQNKLDHATILRIEQFYPLNQTLLESLFKKYQGFKTLVWCQEEPRNMGGWNYIAPILERAARGLKPVYAGRKASASPAAGSLALHRAEQDALVELAFSA
jgi:2-oxoglutarate dehydrogenase E1 component